LSTCLNILCLLLNTTNLSLYYTAPFVIDAVSGLF
jgi:hypothetical protein